MTVIAPLQVCAAAGRRSTSTSAFQCITERGNVHKLSTSHFSHTRDIKLTSETTDSPPPPNSAANSTSIKQYLPTQAQQSRRQLRLFLTTDFIHQCRISNNSSATVQVQELSRRLEQPVCSSTRGNMSEVCQTDREPIPQEERALHHHCTRRKVGHIPPHRL